MRWWRITRLVSAMMIVLAGSLLLLHVRVKGGPAGSLTCGTAWDVISGRTGWREWWSADQISRATSAALPRTRHCPGAVDTRLWLAAGAFAAALATAVTGEFFGRADERKRHPLRTIPRPGGLIAIACVVVGVMLTLAGVVGIALLVADPHDPLFLYASRTVVVLVGLLLLAPAVLISVVGLLARSTPADHALEGPNDERI